MARFYGTVQGGRGQASRLGHANTGLSVTAKSYQGDIAVQFYAEGDVDYVCIRAEEHYGSGSVLLYSGPVKELLTPAARLEFLKQAAKDLLTTI